MRRFEDGVIVVAGAGSGIGAATARRLAGEGARVIAGDIAVENAEQVAAEITAEGGAAPRSATTRPTKTRSRRSSPRPWTPSAGWTVCTPTPPT